jgi:transcription-repair coupling factor (superfamily II helicase)
VNLLSRFNTSEDSKPRLSKLGGTEWERTKRKVKKSVRKIAQDLINLYAARAKQSGYCYPPDTPWQIEMEDAFPYTETSDQLKAIQEVKADMEAAKLMDRLICGDAGFGKTEVIIRAVFKSIMDAKQVAILVPTTVLAQQHFNVFKDRYAPYPIKVGLLCRFRTAREQKETVDRLKIGECDLVIGTHRLLQKDIQFKNLGLLVIDEEQRFGVAHKEKLKSLRQDLDIISMSATPIPRTLHMSISGMKDISLISTPPKNRLPVKTYVGEYKNSVIRTAILHELERGGQVFFVHNRIENIDAIAMMLQELVPEAKIRTAHGKMAEAELEDVMFSFVNNEFDILVCTTIIETGLDIPNANTIIINDANAFGLSQLYQLRGRVGRSDVQAYAYLMYRPEADISDTARHRLKAIRELTNLGAGYQVAMRDMEIRGVGNVFGAEQHGQMLSVGFDLYCKILSDTIEEMKGNIDVEDLERDTVIDIKIGAFFPENWLSDPKQRMNEYRRLAMIRDERVISSLITEWTDRFGKLPAETLNLIEILRIKLLAKAAKISNISQEGDTIKIYNDMRLGKWIPMQRALSLDLQAKTTFKPGTYGSRSQESYIALKISHMDSDAILHAIKEVVLKLKESSESQD